MAEPAYGGADGPRPERPQADVRDLALWAETCAKQVAILASRPDDGAALEMARLCLAGLERACETGRQWTVSEALLEAVRQQAFDEGVKACRAQRYRLRVVD
jgi:hypothetical protein